jgi:RimJ/RimL family protein N-acetyltransferase
VGSQLVGAFARHYHGLGCVRLDVGTQVANLPSVRCYERLGFRLSSSSYVLHLHAGA